MRATAGDATHVHMSTPWSVYICTNLAKTDIKQVPRVNGPTSVDSLSNQSDGLSACNACGVAASLDLKGYLLIGGRLEDAPP